MPLFHRRSPLLNPPEGFGAADIRTQSSICTGETTVGFYDSRTGRLLQAVVVRTPQDLADFYHSYGFEPPERRK